MRRRSSLRSVAFLSVLSLSWSVLSGCGSTPERPTPGEDAYFPTSPDLARIQYLCSFNGSQDLRTDSGVVDFLAGVEEKNYILVKPFSLAVWNGRIYVTDSFGLQGLNVFDLKKREFYIVGKEQGSSYLGKPIHVFIDRDGLKYVSDLARRRVVVFDRDDNYVRSYGDGSSFTPVCCVVNRNLVYIIDVQKDLKTVDWYGETVRKEVRRDQILVLDKASGKPLRRIGRHGTDQDGFRFASFLTLDRKGRLYVSDFMNHRVVKLDNAGKVYRSFGQNGNRPGDFSKIKGIAVDRDGLIYAVDAAFQTVQVFDNSGSPLFVFGGASAPRGAMNLPAGVWIDYDNLEYFRQYVRPEFEPEYLIFVTNQLSQKNRITVYAYGRRKDQEYPPETDVVTIDSGQEEPLWRLPAFRPRAAGAKTRARSDAD